MRMYDWLFRRVRHVGTSNRPRGAFYGYGPFLIVFALERKSECKERLNERKGL